MNSLFAVCTVADRCVAFEASAVQSVIEIGAVACVPRAPANVVGLCAVRSQVLTVIDLSATVGESPEDGSLRAVVINIDGQAYALRIANVIDVVASCGDVQAIDASVGASWHQIAIGRVETAFGFALLLDPAKIIGLPVACRPED